MLSSGKWYWEVKMTGDAGSDRTRVGLAAYESVTGTSTIQGDFSGVEFTCTTSGRLNIVTSGSNNEIDGFNSYSTGDIIQFALDMDNHLLWFGINGTWQNSATQTEIENSTATNDATTKVGEQTFLTNFDDITIFIQDVNSSCNAHAQLNTGNPAFSISSGNTDGKYGNFEYSVPSGYYALCTKRLAEFG